MRNRIGTTGVQSSVVCDRKGDFVRPPVGVVRAADLDEIGTVARPHHVCVPRLQRALVALDGVEVAEYRSAAVYDSKQGGERGLEAGRCACECAVDAHEEAELASLVLGSELEQ